MDYDKNVLEIIAKIIPRIVLMSSQKSKATDSIDVCLLRDDTEQKSAQLLKNAIKANYPKGIKNTPINFVISDFDNANACRHSQITFMFNSNNKKIRETVTVLNQFQLLTMSYDEKFLEHGVGLSLFIGKKVVPYINTQAIFDNNIEINNMLLRVSKIYQKKN
ncbi:MAG: DUF4154 domain-containing protein [Gammaproteobacteria bacterium]|nr:DUF4154 domain-containing protein [Gammaproteobacteria bacterium]